jgi:hypothetical protein
MMVPLRCSIKSEGHTYGSLAHLRVDDRRVGVPVAIAAIVST